MTTPYGQNKYNPRPSRDKIIQELTRECEKTRESDGNFTYPVRVWLIRRALEYLQEDEGKLCATKKDRSMASS